MGSTKGLGLGLAIAKKFAEAHGGLLTFTTQPGKGTTFIIRLPLDGPAQNAGMVVAPVPPLCPSSFP
jgi:signal transduction histidine kinase